MDKTFHCQLKQCVNDICVTSMFYLVLLTCKGCFFFGFCNYILHTCFCLRLVFRTCSCVDFSQSPVLPCLRSMLDATQLMGWGGVGC